MTTGRINQVACEKESYFVKHRFTDTSQSHSLSTQPLGHCYLFLLQKTSMHVVQHSTCWAYSRLEPFQLVALTIRRLTLNPDIVSETHILTYFADRLCKDCAFIHKRWILSKSKLAESFTVDTTQLSFTTTTSQKLFLPAHIYNPEVTLSVLQTAVQNHQYIKQNLWNCFHDG